MSSELEVSSIKISDLLDNLRTRTWKVPVFQREFVWSIGDVCELVQSIVANRPIGMVTVWKLPEKTDLNLEPISIKDNKGTAVLDSLFNIETSETYAILDGRQRCTAIAIAFGGLRPSDGRQKFGGRFYLNVNTENEDKRIEFIRAREVANRGLDNDARAIGEGLFPLSSSDEGENLSQQWYRYTQSIKDASNYSNRELPCESELERRNNILRRSYEGLMNTRVAVNTVPSSYSLPQICEIFEVLNTTGTKVSTVDLIHSWIFSDTSIEGNEAILVRDWIDQIGELEGAVGWASSNDRPELIAQMVTASYIAIESKPEPRQIGRTDRTKIETIGSGDLLSTPTLHWKHIIDKQAQFAEFLGDFQVCVAEGYFNWKSCPYPATAAIYVGLRWYLENEIEDSSNEWSKIDLDAIFRAFFWRNALNNRYDQGQLTAVGSDLTRLKDKLSERKKFSQFDEWANAVNDWFDKDTGFRKPSTEELEEFCTDSQRGALQKAMVLPLVANAQYDLLDRGLEISYPRFSDMDLHHIYPKKWCRSNQTTKLKAYLDPIAREQDWVNSAANLMPLSRESNNRWRDENPGAILSKENINYQVHGAILSNSLISEAVFQILKTGEVGVPKFWIERGKTMANYFLDAMEVSA